MKYMQIDKRNCLDRGETLTPGVQEYKRRKILLIHLSINQSWLDQPQKG